MILLKCKFDHVTSLLKRLQWSHPIQSTSQNPYSGYQADVLSPICPKFLNSSLTFHPLILLQPHRSPHRSLETPGMPLAQDICVYCPVCLEPRHLCGPFYNLLRVLAQMSLYVWNLLQLSYFKKQQHTQVHCIKQVFCFLYLLAYCTWVIIKPTF